MSLRVALTLMLALLVCSRAGADPMFDSLADKIRQSEEHEPGIPMDRALYADQVTYGHNIGEAHASPAARLLATIGPEQESFKRFVSGRQAKLTRFVAEGNTIVAETEMSGTLPDQTRFSTKTAIFFTIEQGKIAAMELWADPILGQKFAGYMAQDPAVVAARGKH